MAEQDDAFAPQNIGPITYITLARIYDVLVAILAVQSPERHRDLLEAHAKGLLLGPSPVFEGIFVTDEINPNL